LLYLVGNNEKLLLSKRSVEGCEIRDNTVNGTMQYDIYVKYRVDNNNH